MVDRKDNVVDFKAHLKKRQQSEELVEENDIPLSIVESNEEKCELFSQWIDAGMVMVTLNSSLLGVKVPEQIQGLIQLNLNFSHNFYLDDFEYDRRGVRASLSFSGRSYFCEIPWPAIWTMRSDVLSKVAISPKSVPLELRDVVIGDQFLLEELQELGYEGDVSASISVITNTEDKQLADAPYFKASVVKLSPKQGELFAGFENEAEVSTEQMTEELEDSLLPAEASSHLHLVE